MLPVHQMLVVVSKDTKFIKHGGIKFFVINQIEIKS
jgi:hypothetical protein